MKEIQTHEAYFETLEDATWNLTQSMSDILGSFIYQGLSASQAITKLQEVMNEKHLFLISKFKN